MLMHVVRLMRREEVREASDIAIAGGSYAPVSPNDNHLT